MRTQQRQLSGVVVAASVLAALWCTLGPRVAFAQTPSPGSTPGQTSPASPGSSAPSSQRLMALLVRANLDHRALAAGGISASEVGALVARAHSAMLEHNQALIDADRALREAQATLDAWVARRNSGATGAEHDAAGQAAREGVRSAEQSRTSTIGTFRDSVLGALDADRAGFLRRWAQDAAAFTDPLNPPATSASSPGASGTGASGTSGAGAAPALTDTERQRSRDRIAQVGEQLARTWTVEAARPR